MDDISGTEDLLKSLLDGTQTMETQETIDDTDVH